MTDMSVEVPYMCPEDGCTKSFGHELDKDDADHGDGMYKILVTLSDVYVKPWGPNRYELKHTVHIKLSDDQAVDLIADGWNVRHSEDPERSVFKENCFWLRAEGHIATTKSDIFGPVDVVLRGLDWTLKSHDLSGRKAFLVDVTDRLVLGD